MTLSIGARLGPYEILAPLGAGGMGEVYRARDPRIGREVAIKVLHAAVARDPDRLRRFQQEVQAAGALNHPNILAIHDVGAAQDGAPYIVSELLEGETLRARLAGGAIGQRKAIEFAVAIARGLAAAHDKGIVHRDLKPENIFLTTDGRVKILDFGLAKLIHAEAESQGSTVPTAALETEPGVVLGTVGYMSPEQVRGRPADHRADIFSFGCMVYEMLSGRRAFQRETAPETLTAILNEEPPPLADANLDRIVRRCLEKNPYERFHSASDLGFALEAVTGVSMTGRIVTAPPVRRRRLVLALASLAPAALGAAGFGLGRWTKPSTPVVYNRLTFRRGAMGMARFAPDGQTIIYGASWEGNPVQLFSTRPGIIESSPLPLPAADILAISPSGEMAISLGRSVADVHAEVGKLLARVPLTGGTPREVAENVVDAEWGPDGRTLIVARQAEGHGRIEFPLGRVIYEAVNAICRVRLSPDGKRIGVLEEGLLFSIVVMDLDGKNRKVLLEGTEYLQDLAWSPTGDELWFEGAKGQYSYHKFTLQAVSLAGRRRTLLQVPGMLRVLDTARDGRLLAAHYVPRESVRGVAPGESKEKDLSWLDGSELADLSADGKTVLIQETLEGGGEGGAIYLRRTDGSAPVRLGDGAGLALSPDGKWVLAMPPSSAGKEHKELLMLPTGAGESRPLRYEGMERYAWGRWSPDGRRILFVGSEPGGPPRFYMGDAAGGKPRPLAPGYPGGSALSPDGKLLAVGGADGQIRLYPVDGGEPRMVRAERGDRPIQWSEDGRFLYVFRQKDTSAIVYRLEPATGRRELWKEIAPPEPAGIWAIWRVTMAPDGKSYAYGYVQTHASLYLLEGVR